FNRVVLPAPLAPTRPMIPGSTLTDRSARAVTPEPYRMVSDRVSINGTRPRYAGVASSDIGSDPEILPYGSRGYGPTEVPGRLVGVGADRDRPAGQGFSRSRMAGPAAAVRWPG